MGPIEEIQIKISNKAIKYIYTFCVLLIFDLLKKF